MCEFRHFRSPWSQRCSPECSHPQPHSEPAWVKRWERFEKVKVSKKTFFLSTLTLPFVPPLHFYSRHTGTPRLCLRPSEEYGWVTSFPPIYFWGNKINITTATSSASNHHLYVVDSGLVGLPINIDGDHEAAKRGKAESQLPEKLTISSTNWSSFLWKPAIVKNGRLPAHTMTSSCHQDNVPSHLPDIFWYWYSTSLILRNIDITPPWYFLILILHLSDIF